MLTQNIENIEEDFFHRHIQQRPTFTFTSHPDTKTTIYTKNRALEYRQIDVSAFPTEFSCLIPRKANENPSILISKVQHGKKIQYCQRNASKKQNSC